jgi:hypothetical protein
LPDVEVLLLKLFVLNSVVGEPVQKFDGDRDGLFATKESADRYFLHLVHPALVLPADVAADHVVMPRVCEAFDRAVGPVGVAGSVYVAAREDAVLDEQAADKLASTGAGQRIDGVMGHRLGDGELLQELGDVALADPGQATICSFH